MFKKKIAFIVFCSLALANCNCNNGSHDDPPEPFQDLPEVVKEAVWQWLDFRFDEETWYVFVDATSGWRQCQNLLCLEVYFKEFADSIEQPRELWDFSVLVDEIKSTSFYKDEEPNEQQLFNWVYQSMEEFIYQP